MRFGNFDPDVVRCQAELLAEQLGKEVALMTGAQAVAILGAKDKAATEDALAQREKAWRDYFAAYIGAVPAPAPKGVVLPPGMIEPHAEESKHGQE